MAFPIGSAGKEFACNAGDLGWISELGRSPGVGHGNPLQYSCLENSHGQRSLVGYSPWCCQVRQDWVTKHDLTNDVELLFMCLMPICMSVSFGKCLALLPIFQLGYVLFCYWIVWAMCIFWKLSLLVTSFAGTFSHYIGCLFVLFTFCFTM